MFLYEKALLAHEAKNYELSLALLQAAVRNDPDNMRLYMELLEFHRASGRLDEALEVGLEALERFPDDVRVLRNLAFLHYDRGELEESKQLFSRAISIDSDDVVAHIGLGLCYLAGGEYQLGWQEHSWRWRMRNYNDLVPKSRPKWDGVASGKTLLLICGEGAGDTIHFSRFIPQIEDRVGKLAVLCKPEMKWIIRQQTSAPIVTSLNDIPEYDVYAMLLDSHGALGFWNYIDRPYVKPERSDNWKKWLDKKLIPYPNYKRVGLVWAGDPTHSNDFRRSIDFNKILSLTTLDNVVLIGLQKGGHPPLPEYVGPAPFISVHKDITDYSDTASIIDNLDLVISVDTSVAHLAGAMGKEVWLLLPYSPDWRWPRKGATSSHWYPSMKIFQQTRPNDWDGVISRVINEFLRAGDRRPRNGDPIKLPMKEHSLCPL